MYYNPKDFQFGTELELGDVLKSTPIPEHLGKWEYAEYDIINMLGEYRGVAVDPLGIACPVGGEINTMPTVGWEDQLERVMEIINMFPNPTMSHLQVTHIHIHVPNLVNDGEALRRLALYSIDEDNHQAYLNTGFKLHDSDFEYVDKNDVDLFGTPKVKMYPHVKRTKTRTYRWYMDYESICPIPDWYRARLETVSNLDELLSSHICGEYRTATGRRRGQLLPRMAVNLYSLRWLQTVEFRAFRGTLDRHEFQSCFEFCHEYMNAALNTGEPVSSFLARNPHWVFPKIKYDHELMVAYDRSLTQRNAEKFSGPKGVKSLKNRELWTPNN